MRSLLPREVSTSGLKADLIPDPNGPLDPSDDGEPAIWRFAQTFDVNSFADEKTSLFLTRSAMNVYEATETLPDLDLDGYRACLAIEYSHWRATGPGGSLARGASWESMYSQHASFVRELVREIHKEVFQEESWWWEPNKTPTDDERVARSLSWSRQPRQLARLLDLAGEHISEHNELDLMESFERGDDPYLRLRAQAAYFLAQGLVDSAGTEQADITAYGMAARLRGQG